jgi:hypothetical protein
VSWLPINDGKMGIAEHKQLVAIKAGMDRFQNDLEKI